ncbi:hypothetical protein ACFXTI_014401 [Malus domestica]
MGDHEEHKRAEGETPSVSAIPPAAEVPAVVKNEGENHATEDKSLIPIPEETASPPPAAPAAAVKEIADPAVKKGVGSSTDRDVLFAKIEMEKRLALIKAWEESEKTKAENKAYRRMSIVELWENNKRTNVEAELRKIEEKYEKKKAGYAEKMKNKVAEIHKTGEERRAIIEAKEKEQSLKVEETAAKFRSTGNTPKKLLLWCCVCQHSAVK